MLTNNCWNILFARTRLKGTSGNERDCKRGESVCFNKWCFHKFDVILFFHLFEFHEIAHARPPEQTNSKLNGEKKVRVLFLILTSTGLYFSKAQLVASTLDARVQRMAGAKPAWAPDNPALRVDA